jgi:hypothetical protein
MTTGQIWCIIKLINYCYKDIIYYMFRGKHLHENYTLLYIKWFNANYR